MRQRQNLFLHLIEIETDSSEMSTFQNQAKPQDTIQLQAYQVLPQEFCLREQEKD